MTEQETKKQVIGSWRRSVGVDFITLNIKPDGRFERFNNRRMFGIVTRPLGAITGMDHLIGDWIVEGDILHLYVKKCNGLNGLSPFAMLGTLGANITGTDYGGKILEITETILDVDSVSGKMTRI